MVKLNCYTCKRFVPHDIYAYIGLCMVREEPVLSFRARECDDYEELTLDVLREKLHADGWLYCVDCRTPIFYIEELEKHIGHIVTLSIHSDSVASEEAPPAD